ncbi:MAG: hypothetical protein KDC95_19375, partial [Planctomycetes bacterium]|nr:hypothetical protein [Planctomycetota bacterium]
MILAVLPSFGFAQGGGIEPKHFRTEIRAVDGELWGSGFDFKASFHDGFHFYARGNRERETVSLAWSTVAVGLEGREASIAHGDASSLHVDGYRARLDFDGFSEIYDILADGVEQRFVIHEKPSGSGDLVVRGRVTSALRAEERASEHAPISWHDASGDARIVYGKAFVLDQEGARHAIGTRVIGDTVELRVPEAVWQHTTFPLTIDPMIRNGSFANPAEGSRIGRLLTVQREIGTSSDLLVAINLNSRYATDVYVFRCEAGLRNPRVVWSDVRWNVNVKCRDGCFVGGAETALFRL